MKWPKREKEQGLPAPYARCRVLGRTTAGRAGPHVPMLYPMQPDRGRIPKRLQNLQKTCFPFSRTKKRKSVIGEELRGKDTTGLCARHSAARAKPYASPGPHPSTRGHCFSFFCRANRDLRIGECPQPNFWQCHFGFRAKLHYNMVHRGNVTDI